MLLGVAVLPHALLRAKTESNLIQIIRAGLQYQQCEENAETGLEGKVPGP